MKNRGKHWSALLLLVILWGCPVPVTPPADDPYTPSPPSDTGLVLDSTDPEDAANAIGMNDGFVSAEWVAIDGSSYTVLPTNYHFGHGIHANFGATAVREGARLLELSSGMARLPAEPGYLTRIGGYDKGYASTAPAGFPHYDLGALEPGLPKDGIGLKVVLQVPAGVDGFRIDYRYYTADYSMFLQTRFVDQAAGFLTSASGRATMLSFMLDPFGNSLYSSASLLSFGVGLVGGDADLLNSGYYHLGAGLDQGAASAWLTATVAEGAATFAAGDTLEFSFVIWDSDDRTFDSSLLLDNFQWIPE